MPMSASDDRQAFELVRVEDLAWCRGFGVIRSGSISA
jgi:hypothetical protein